MSVIFLGVKMFFKFCLLWIEVLFIIMNEFCDIKGIKYCVIL